MTAIPAENLVQHRGRDTVWADRALTIPRAGERWILGGAAAAVLFAGFRRRSWSGLLLAMGGCGLAWWAAGGTERRGAQVRMFLRRDAQDRIGEASEESFPASDAPAWTSGG